MNFPYPFESARGIKPDAFGRVALVDEGGKVLAHLPLASAHEFAPKCDGSGDGYDGDGYGFGDGWDSGRDSCKGSGFGDGFGGSYGDGNFDGAGSGRGK
jgi:hypothetical protein